MTQAAQLIQKDGQAYLRVGDRAIPVELDENGRPKLIKPQITRTEHEGGRVDVTVGVPCLRVVDEEHDPTVDTGWGLVESLVSLMKLPQLLRLQAVVARAVAQIEAKPPGDDPGD